MLSKKEMGVLLMEDFGFNGGYSVVLRRREMSKEKYDLRREVVNGAVAEMKCGRGEVWKLLMVLQTVVWRLRFWRKLWLTEKDTRRSSMIL